MCNFWISTLFSVCSPYYSSCCVHSLGFYYCIYFHTFIKNNFVYVNGVVKTEVF